MNKEFIESIDRIKHQVYTIQNEQERENKRLSKEQRRMKRLFMAQSILITFLLVQLTIIFLITK
jgi:predicted nucleic acid-binding Zn ribbon protein